ncbi:MAG: ABC transporter permease [Pyrinomonadaceae bacterium]
MNKFLAVVKYEYRKIVLKWAFVIGTLLFPLLAAAFAVVPAIIFSIKGEPTRISVVDPTGQILPRLKRSLSADAMAARAKEAMTESLGDFSVSQDEKTKRSVESFGENFEFIDHSLAGKSADQIQNELLSEITSGRLDAYLIIPDDIESPDAKFIFRSRNAGDFVTNESLENALNDAVRTQRFRDANINEDRLEELSRKIKIDVKVIDETGEKDPDSSFIAAFVIGLMIYITLAIYGQTIMAAVVEEKETRIAEILFSSASPFELMLGKLTGVGLAALTQLGIWIISGVVLVGIGLAQMDAIGVNLSIPAISPLMIVYFFVFFLLGFFIYASIFALIGSMVTTVQEGGQFAFPPIMILLVGFYFCFAVIRDPDSTLSFWVSIAPFFAPITMPVRILSEMPPFWQIALAILVNGLAIAGIIWIAAKVYRVGMLMYGKRATIPEVFKWIRQS